MVTLSTLSVILDSLLSEADILLADLRYHQRTLNYSKSTNIPHQILRDLRVDVVSLKQEGVQHYLDSVTVEIQVQLYAELAPDSTNTLSLLDRSKGYKWRVDILGGKMWEADWIWAGISERGRGS